MSQNNNSYTHIDGGRSVAGVLSTRRRALRAGGCHRTLFFLKLLPRPNDCNISTQKCHNVVGPNILGALGHPFAKCCGMLGVDGASLKMVNISSNICRCCMMCTRLARFVFCASACKEMFSYIQYDCVDRIEVVFALSTICDI